MNRNIKKKKKTTAKILRIGYTNTLIPCLEFSYQVITEKPLFKDKE